MKQSFSFVLISILVSGLLLAGITSFGQAQDPSSFTISGYILDEEGNGISGANIIFNVPQIVPSVYSDSSGYYEISAPAGTYHVNVWPPFDSNHLSYDEAAFVVNSDVTKNITLDSGYKISGYITDTYGRPIIKAVVSLDNFFCGWYSKYSGRYFVTAPAGTYTLRAKPANGPQGVSDFLSYSEEDVVVSVDLEKNFTVELPPPTKISGYILDDEGNGIADVHVIFNVPDIVPVVQSDSSGYYEIYAPVGTYYVNVWPPFDSNYLFFEELGFAVGASEISKNITLGSGFKLSGYLTDASGAPIRGAYASLDSFYSGWFSDGSGYYFVAAPAGTYTLTVQSKRGPTFPTYTETGFVLSGDTVKNITLTQPANVTFSDNFDDGVADGWTQHEGSWSVKDGEYFVSVGVVEDAITTVDGLDFIDCTVETNLRFTDSVGFRSGIIFRFIDSTHYYSIELGNEYDTLDMIKYTPGNPGYGETFAQIRDTNFQKDTDYQLKIVVSGDVFRCFLEGEEVLSGTDSSYTHGGVGLRARRADIYFDNFTVENGTAYDGVTDDDPQEPGDPELLVWWKLNEGAGTVVTDSSGNNDVGTINGANWLNYEGTSSLNFDGVSDYVSLPSMDLTDLDSLTVVSWINSDLTEAGFIVYHGDGGEFQMGNGDRDQYAQNLGVDALYASFSVKLNDYRWYGVQSAFQMQPNVWHQIVGVWEKGVSLKVYVDGILAGENSSIPAERLYNPGVGFPSSLGIYAQDRWGKQDFFKGQISNVMVYNKALTLQEINDLYDDVPVPTVARPTLTFSCKNLASSSGLNVQIEGSLTLNETVVADAPILLSYSANGGKSWQDLSLFYTDSAGLFSATLLPQITGNYLLKATYEGDANKLAATATVDFEVTSFTEDATVFSGSSNSTVTALDFDNKTSELSFTVTEPSGTSDCVDCTVAKSPASDGENINLFSDGTAPSSKGCWTWAVAPIVLVLIGIGVVYFKIKNRE